MSRRNSYNGIERIEISRLVEDEDEIGTYARVATIADLAVLRLKPLHPERLAFTAVVR